MRLFIAIRLETPVVEALWKTEGQLRSYAEKGSFPKKENLHLTLTFLGETENSRLAEQVLSAIDAAPFLLITAGAGRFDGKNNRDTYWAGIRENPALMALQEQLVHALRSNGCSLEERSYWPHVTLGRNVQIRKAFSLDEFAAEVPQMQMPVAHISLMRSEQIGGEHVYTEIYTKRLDGGPLEGGAKRAAGEKRTIVYIVQCTDGTLYTGWTDNLEKRLAAHNAGRGAKYTRSRRPVRLVHWEELPDRSAALRREAQIKRMSRAQKLALIQGQPLE